MSGVSRVMDLARMTRMFSACAVLALAACALSAASSQASVELRGAVPTSYSYRVAWSPEERMLEGTGTIRFENRSSRRLEDLYIRLRPNSGGRLQRLGGWTNVSRITGVEPLSLAKVTLLKPVDPGAKSLVRIVFELHVPRERTSLGRSAGIDLFGDALPVVSLEGPRRERTEAEPSYGEGSFNPVANWKVQLTIPRGERAVLPGSQRKVRQTRSSTVYATEAKVRDVAFAVGRFRTLSRKVDGVRVSVAAGETLRSELPAALRRAVHAFTTLQRWYGGYNLPTLKIVIGDLEFGGSEYPGLVFSTPDNATIAHEVAHQWFYGLVGNDQYNDPFLDESLTAFSEQRFHKSYRCDLARPIRGKHGLGTGMSYWEKHAAAYEDTIYRGGACALTVLQRDLGADVLDRALRAYVAANADKITGVNDFLAAIGSAAPWYDLERWQRLVGLN